MRILIRALASGILLLSVTLLSGCAEIPDVAQSRYSQPVGEIHGSRTVGQTFVSHENDLSRIEVLLATYARKNSYPVTFRLKESPDDAGDIATITINAARVKDNAFQQFRFAPIPDSEGKSYFFAVESPESVTGNAITLWHDPDDAYDEGAMYVDGQATGGDLAFRTYYGRGLGDVVGGVRSGIGRGLSLLVLATLLFTLPGNALLTLLWPWKGATIHLLPPDRQIRRLDRLNSGGSSPSGQDLIIQAEQSEQSEEEFDFTQRLVLSIGLSLTLFPLLLFISSKLGFRLDSVKAVGLLVVCGGVSCWGLYRALRRGQITSVRDLWRTTKLTFHVSRFTGLPRSETFDKLRHGGLAPCLASLAFVFALSLAVRFLMIRETPFPAWSDSYHHTIISQMIAEEGLIPQSYQPYMPVEPFAYHFGFHSTVAFFHWITGMGLPEAVLAVGQILNALAALSIYLLTHYLTKDRWAAFVSALIAGLISIMPAYYVNWGRYTQLCGQVIFPVAAVLTARYLGTGRLDYKHLILIALAAGGLFLTHYRVLLFYGLFVAAYVLCESWFARREPRKVANLWLRSFLLAFLSLTIISPWLRPMLSEFAVKSQQAQAHGFQLDPDYNLISWGIVTSLGLRPALLVMAALGALWGFWRRDRYVVLVIVWTVSLFVLANPHLLGLPGAGMVNNGAVIIALYIPGSILAGFFSRYSGQTLVSALEGWPAFGRLKRWSGYGLAAVVILVSLWGAGNILQLLTPETFFVTKSDLKAMDWIRENVPEGARFAINTHFWLSYAAIGTDAGYWIPFLTRRETSLPPMLYSEGTYEYVDEVNALAEATIALSENDDTLPILREDGVTHVYIGQRGGSLKPQRLLASPNYEAIYHQDGVWVFEISRSE